MTDKKDSGKPLFYVLKSGSGFEEGVYLQSELPHLPKEAQKYVVPLAVAAALEYVEYDRTAKGDINSLSIYASVNPKTKTTKKIHGIEEGLVQSGPYSANILEKVENTTDKIGNSLRDKLQEVTKNSAENSLKAQIEAKKKQLQTNKE